VHCLIVPSHAIRSLKKNLKHTQLSVPHVAVINKKAVLSQRWPRNAPYTWLSWKFSGLPDYAHGYYSQHFSLAFVRIDPHITYLDRNLDPWATFLSLIVWVYLHANFSGWLRKTCVMQQSAEMPPKVISGSTKVVDFGTNRKRIYDFLLVINGNLCRISHRFGDTAVYWWKIANSYPPHPHLTPSLGVNPFEFWDDRDIPRN